MPMFHAVFTVILFLIFIGIVIWAYGPKRKAEFDEAARLPFADEPSPPGSVGGASSSSDAHRSDAKNGEKA
ncbi:MAG: cbb3-type cytochrome c oxidase subunit 3 [Gammaproteobacteria bacterium]